MANPFPRLLTRLLGRRSFGFVIEDENPDVTEGAVIHSATADQLFLGPTLRHQESFPVSNPGPAGLVQAIKSLFTGLVGSDGPPQSAVVALSPRMSLYRVRPIEGGRDTIPEESPGPGQEIPLSIRPFLPKNIPGDSLIARWGTVRVQDKDLAYCLATRRTKIATEVQAFTMAGVPSKAHIPAEFAALATSLHFAPIAGRKTLTVRFLWGPNDMVWWVLHGVDPLLWHTQRVRTGDEPASLCLGAIRRIESGLRGILPGARISQIDFQGFDREASPVEFVASQTQASCLDVPGPPLTPVTLAQGAALVGLDEGTPRFDLASHLVKRQQSLLHLIPVIELVFLACMIGVMGFAYHLGIGSVETAAGRVDREIQAYPWGLKVPIATLMGERDELQKRQAGLKIFLESEFRWTPHLLELSRLIPEGTRVTALVGEGNLGIRKLSAGVVATENLGRLVFDLKTSPVYRQVFPDVDMESLGVSFVKGNLEGVYQIVCTSRQL